MNSKFKSVIAVVSFPFLWALLGTMLSLLMTALNGGVEDITLNVVAGFFGLVMMIISYVIIFKED
jgi:hypothetical protein